MKRAGLALVLAAAGMLPASAAARAPARLTLTLPDVFVIHRDAVSVPGRAVHVVGTVRPYVAGQSVSFRATDGTRVIKQTRYRLKPVQHGRAGQFTAWVRAPEPGIVRITVTHQRNRHQVGFIGRRAYATLDPAIGFGATGWMVQLVQQQLAALHFYIPQTGVYDQGTGLALDAYHRLLRWGTSPSLDPATLSELLNHRGSFRVRFPSHGRHAEGDLTTQLIALADGPNVQWIFPTSSGKPSTPTILGDYQIYERVPGYRPDGMYYSSFFVRGYAIHGYDPAPDYPASHGCMRLPLSDAIPAYDWLALGDWVDVYYE